MMHKDMQAIKTAVRPVMAGSYEPARQELAMLRTGFFVTAACITVCALILIIA